MTNSTICRDKGYSLPSIWGILKKPNSDWLTTITTFSSEWISENSSLVSFSDCLSETLLTCRWCTFHWFKSSTESILPDIHFNRIVSAVPTLSKWDYRTVTLSFIICFFPVVVYTFSFVHFQLFPKKLDLIEDKMSQFYSPVSALQDFVLNYE